MTPLGTVTSWTGWDVRAGASAPSNVTEAFTQASLSDSSTETRYELLAVAARGFRPPRFLREIELPGADQTHPEDQPASGAVDANKGLRQTWSLLYRRVAQTAEAVIVPYAIYLLGVNPPANAMDEDLKVFNEFYTNVHLPEVAERRHALRAVRYELVREVRPPYNGAPRFLAVYELDENAASIRRHVGPRYADGPDVWQRHTTPWRLWYRRLVITEREEPQTDANPRVEPH